jgi:hypothetical protein
LPSLFVGNFDFEHRLAFGTGSLPRRLEEINASLAPVWVAASEQGDAVWTASPNAPAVFERLSALGLPRVRAASDVSDLGEPHHLVFWGENEWAAAFAAINRRSVWEGCDPGVVRRVNSRTYKHAVERKLGVSLEDSALCCAPDELLSAFDVFRDLRKWVLKGEFGGAGREIRFGTGDASAADLAWALNRFRRGLAVTLEPRLDAVEEAGLQFSIGRDREIVFLGVTPLLTRRTGVYLGSGFIDDSSLLSTWRYAIEVGTRAAALVASEGYFGPLGIDAMQYRANDGSIRIRPLQDLNARFTMGRLALGLRRFPDFARQCGGVFRPSDFAAAAT